MTYKTRSDSLLSQEYIKNALSDLLKRRPYDHITITELCKKAGVARITFYKYYNTIDDVYRCLVKRTIDEYIKTVSETNVKDNYEKMLEICFSSLIPYAPGIKNMLYCNKAHLIYEYFRASFKEFVPLKLNSRQMEDLKYTCYTGGLFIIAMEWIRGGMKETPESLAHSVSQILIF